MVLEGAGQKLILAFVTLILGVVLIGTVATQGLVVTQLSSDSQTSINLGGLASCYVNATPAAGAQVNGTNDPDCNITVNYVPTGWKRYDGTNCHISEVVVQNYTRTDTLVSGTDYLLYAGTGIIQMLNTTDTDAVSLGNYSQVSYRYCGDDYLNQGWGRSTLNMVPGFFAIALLLISVYLFFSIAKDYDII